MFTRNSLLSDSSQVKKTNRKPREVMEKHVALLLRGLMAEASFWNYHQQAAKSMLNASEMDHMSLADIRVFPNCQRIRLIFQFLVTYLCRYHYAQVLPTLVSAQSSSSHSVLWCPCHLPSPMDPPHFTQPSRPPHNPHKR